MNSLTEAQAAFDAKDFDGAIQACDELTQDQITNGPAWRLYTIALVAKGDFDRAVETGRKAAAFVTHDADLRYALAYALFRTSHFEDAIFELDSALSFHTTHDGARQLLKAALLQHGKEEMTHDPVKAETALSRLNKLEPHNADCVAMLLDLFHQTHQKGKALTLIKDSPGDVFQSPAVSSRIEDLKKDPDFEKTMNQAMMAQRTAHPAAPVQAPQPQQQQPVRYAPCPACKQPIPDFASICPHCNARLKASGTFAGRDTGPNYTWQEIALTVMAVVYLLFVGSSIAFTYLVVKDLGISIAFNLLGLICSVGILFRNDFIMTIAKWVFIISVLGGLLDLMMAMGLGMPMAIVFAILRIAFSGFMIYLLNLEVD